MSDESEVTPLRLKRPGAAGGPAPGPEAAPPASAHHAESPLLPLPGMASPAAPGSAPVDAGAPERHRRRPSLAPEANAAPVPAVAPAGATPPPPELAPGEWRWLTEAEQAALAAKPAA